MRKILSLFSIASLFVCNTSFGQPTNPPKLTLLEEFTGENCGPCAGANPGVNTLVAANLTKTILLRYQSPIPSAGPIYNQNTTFYANRGPYYGINSAPSGKLDGAAVGNGHVSNINQSSIDGAVSVGTKFNLGVTHTWSTDGTQINAVVTITAASAYNKTGANLKLNAALIEDLHFSVAPGSNGEKDFESVVRQMLPNPTGTALAATWTAGQTQTINLSNSVPTYVDKSGANTRIVVWIQDDSDKKIEQAAKSALVPISVDVSSVSATLPKTLFCTATTASAAATVSIKNPGVTTLTSAKVFYKIDNGAWTSQNWTGSLATGASANVTINLTNIATGSHVFYDSVAMPNNTADINSGNNKSSARFSVANSTTNALPLTTGFENAGNMPTNYVNYDVNGNGDNWELGKGTTNIGHANSAYLMAHPNYNYAAGESNILLLPTPNTTGSTSRALDFWVAYAQYKTENDKLEVVYSTDCGTTWTSVWSSQGAALATAPATLNNFIPTQAQWIKYSINVTAAPSGCLIGLRATSDYGNNLFIDDINLRTGPTGINSFVENNEFSVYPNPATEELNVKFNLTSAQTTTISITDLLGKVIATHEVTNSQSGLHTETIRLTNIPSGVYTVTLGSKDAGSVSKLITVQAK